MQIDKEYKLILFKIKISSVYVEAVYVPIVLHIQEKGNFTFFSYNILKLRSVVHLNLQKTKV